MHHNNNNTNLQIIKKKKKKSMQRTGLSLVIIKVRFRSWGYVKWLHKIIVTF